MRNHFDEQGSDLCENKGVDSRERKPGPDHRTPTERRRVMALDCRPVEERLAGPMDGAEMSAATIAWLTDHAQECGACAVDVRTLLQAMAVQNKLIRSVVSRRRGPFGSDARAWALHPVAAKAPANLRSVESTRGLPARFSSVLDRVSADAAQSLSETARRMLACRALLMVDDGSEARSPASVSISQKTEQSLADDALERLRDLDGLREPVALGLRRGVETLLQRRRSRERMRRDYQRVRRLLLWESSEPPAVPALSDHSACEAARAWAESVLKSPMASSMEFTDPMIGARRDSPPE